MIDPDDGEEGLREGFRRLREEEARAAPSFAAMMARARSGTLTGEEIPGAPPAPTSTEDTLSVRRNRWIRWLPPLAAAAALSTLLLSGSREADREFDRLVTEWSQTSRVALHSPTDRLLTVPGSQYLRSLPTLGSDRPLTTPSQRSRP